MSDIERAIGRAQDRLKGLSVQQFLEDEKTIESVLYNFAIIGEAASKIPTTIRKKHAAIPWQKMIGMRNVVIHEYFRIDFEILWNTIHTDLPLILPALQKLVEEVEVASKRTKASPKRKKNRPL